MSIKYTEESIIKALDTYYRDKSKYRIGNIYLFSWECDFFILRPNGYCVEFEVKISKSDFNNDINKVNKHSALKYGFYKEKHRIKEIEKETLKDQRFKPNKFFYVVPERMVSVKEVPEYAGLIYINGTQLKIIKEAPFIHKEILEKKIEQQLCSKFYYRWLEQRSKRRELEHNNLMIPSYFADDLIILLNNLKEKEIGYKPTIDLILKSINEGSYLKRL